MKFSVICLLVFIASSFATQLTTSNTNTYIQKFEQLKNDHKWASIVVKMAQLHLQAQGPIDTLVAAIQDLVVDLNTKLENAHQQFSERTTQHESEDRRLGDLIRRSDRDISEANIKLDEILFPQRDHLTELVAELSQNLIDYRQHIVDGEASRRREHEDYQTRQEEHGSAIEAIGQAVELLDSLLDGGSETQLVQITKLKKNLEKAQKKLQGHVANDIDSIFVNVLVELSTEEFADSTGVIRVRNLLLDVRDRLTVSMAAEQQAETEAQASFEEDMRNTHQSISTASQNLITRTDELNATTEDIQGTQELIETRTADKANYQAALDAENEAFAAAEIAYNELIEQFQHELDACAQALDIVQNLTMEDYIGNRVNQDVVIDQAHNRGNNVYG